MRAWAAFFVALLGTAAFGADNCPVGCITAKPPTCAQRIERAKAAGCVIPCKETPAAAVLPGPAGPKGDKGDKGEPGMTTVFSVPAAAAPAPRGNWFIPVTAGYLRGPFGAAGAGYEFANHWSIAGQAVYGQINGIDGSIGCAIRCKTCNASFQGATTHEWGGAVTLSIPLR